MYRMARSSATGVVHSFNPTTEFTNLKIMGIARSDLAATADAIVLRFNSDNTTMYSLELLGASGSAAFAVNSTNTASPFINCNAGNSPANTYTAFEMTINDYNSTRSEKSCFIRYSYRNSSAPGDFHTNIQNVWWQSTAPLTQIDLIMGLGGKFDGSPVTLYGLK